MKEANGINRAARRGAPVFCSRACAGERRRCNKSPEQLKAEKADYDARYRAANGELLKNKKQAYFLRTYDPAKAAEARKLTMPRHVEYCRRPAYRAMKKIYDQQRRDRLMFGDMAEVAPVLRELEQAISARASRYEIYMMNGTINKKQQRKRQYEQSVCR